MKNNISIAYFINYAPTNFCFSTNSDSFYILSPTEGDGFSRPSLFVRDGLEKPSLSVREGQLKPSPSQKLSMKKNVILPTQAQDSRPLPQ